MSIEFASHFSLNPIKFDEQPLSPIIAPALVDHDESPLGEMLLKPSPASGDQISEETAKKQSIAGKYQILREIGHGAQCKVFEACRIADGAIVVVKQLNINSIKTWKEYELFNREAKVLRTLDIDGVAKFYDAFECLDDDPPCSYIAQEFIPGVSMQKMLKDGHRFSVDDVYDIIIQTLTILDKLHRHDPPIIHRDIKPSNLMMTPGTGDGFKVTIIDFGAVANPQIQSGGSTVAGTYGYMPPEQLTGNPVPASDIYAVGALAVQLFSGISPGEIEVKDFRLIFEPLMQDKPHELVSLLRQMLEPRVEDRLADIPQIIDDLQHIHDNRLDIVKSGKRCKSNYAADYKKKLTTVSSVCEPGNIEIWQQLPEGELRDVPDVYRNFYQDELDKYQETTTQLKKSQRVRKFVAALIAYPVLVIFYLLVLAVCLVLGLLICCFSISTGFTLIIGGFVLPLDKTESIKRAIYRFFGVKHVSSLPEPEKLEQYKDILSLIGNSRKSIATITGVTYIPVSDDSVKIIHQKEDTVRLMVNDYPKLKIQYKFNPPDDKREEDIIHEYVTTAEPENHYKIGDTMPILYKVIDKYYRDTVQSMPFPLPLMDIENSDFILASSSSPIYKDMGDVVDDNIDVYATYGFKTARVATSYMQNGGSAVYAKLFEQHNDVYRRLRELNCAKSQVSICDAIRKCCFNNVEKNKIILPYIAQKLLSPQDEFCHQECIMTLKRMAFPLDGTSINAPYKGLPEALDVILDYIRLKPRSFGRPSVDNTLEFIRIKNRLYSKCAAESHSTDEFNLPKDYNLQVVDDLHHAAPPTQKILNEFCLGLVDIMCDRYVSLQTRTLIADGFMCATPKWIKIIALSKIQNIKDPFLVSIELLDKYNINFRELDNTIEMMAKTRDVRKMIVDQRELDNTTEIDVREIIVEQLERSITKDNSENS